MQKWDAAKKITNEQNTNLL